MPQRQFINFTINGTVLEASLLFPPGYDEESNTKYPVLIDTYQGPGSQDVMRRYQFGFDEFLASQGIIVAMLDGRGTGWRGDTFEKIVYKQLGKYETEDQTQFAEELGKLSYVDSSRIGIWGWSYGGFMAAYCFSYSDKFSLAISVAPVTDWQYYDTVYTERYMQTPAQNPLGYNGSSIACKAPQFSKSRDFLLAHGTADDNVHFQNAAELAAALVRVNYQFHYFAYTNSNHGISYQGGRTHLYTFISQFIEDNWGFDFNLND